MRIFITGGSGNLGKELQLISKNQIIAPSSKEFNLMKESLELPENIQLVIHCAAYTDVARAETDRENCFKLNVTGTEKLIKQAKKQNFNTRFVHISTDYVFDGKLGNYKETDQKAPINTYGLTKSLAEEQIIKSQLNNFLIIRTSFKPKTPWKYPKAFTDVFTSADYVDIIAPLILEASLDSQLTGLVHIGTETKSIYELAKRRNPDILKMSTSEVNVSIPNNPYLCLDKWNEKKWKI